MVVFDTKSLIFLLFITACGQSNIKEYKFSWYNSSAEKILSIQIDAVKSCNNIIFQGVPLKIILYLLELTKSDKFRISTRRWAPLWGSVKKIIQKEVGDFNLLPYWISNSLIVSDL